MSFAREIPGLARQQVSYCALSTGEVAVFSRWHALKVIEVSELVDHPFRWVEIEKFISKPDAKQAAPGVQTIDGKLQMRVFSGTLGEIAKDGILGAVRRNFSAKAGEVLQDSVCVYQPLLAGRAPREVKSETNTLRIGDWRIRHQEDGLSVENVPTVPVQRDELTAGYGCHEGKRMVVGDGFEPSKA